MKSNIRKLRNEKQISQSTLADIIGKTQQTVSHMERDRNRIPIESLITLADYFEVSTDYILGIEPREKFEDKGKEETGTVILNTENFRFGTDIFSNTPGENKDILYRLILSLLLYSLESDAEAVPISQ